MAAKSYKSLKTQYEALPDQVRQYLYHLADLLNYSDRFEITLAYIFMKLEEGHHRALKCGLVRIHKCHSGKADEALEKQHSTRKHFHTVCKNVLGKEIPTGTKKHLEDAENIRDRQIHGKTVSSAQLRQGISDALTYIEHFGQFVEGRTGKNPYGDLRGLASRTQLLDETTSFWVCRGVGLFT